MKQIIVIIEISEEQDQKFGNIENGTAEENMHEALCEAIHGGSIEAFQWLCDHVIDIETKTAEESILMIESYQNTIDVDEHNQ